MTKQKREHQKYFLAASVILNIGTLLYFKYANFFVGNLNNILQAFGIKAFEWTKIMMPIGISFFTFQKMTYSIDVYRGEAKKLDKVSDLGVYILMFTHLIAGPIVRYHEISDQLIDREYNENNNNRITGFFRFCIGLAKKALIANTLGQTADYIFGLEQQYFTTSLAWIGITAYTLQIYYDFSGYSDMALGLGRMIGFDFPENFNHPYISQNISEFWRRWHMTLGKWMKDYLYIPLGGNKVSKNRMYLNLILVFLISGFWHGAAWTFIFWGVYHGVFLILDRIFLIKLMSKTGKGTRIILTFFLVMIGWVFFRAANMSQAFFILSKMFSTDFRASNYMLDMKFWGIMGAAFFFAWWGFTGHIEKWQNVLFAKNKSNKALLAMTLASIVLFVLSVASITTSGFNPFIYFRF